MIKVEFNRDRQKRITSFSLFGHADYAPAGKDIVCAAVSGISFGAVNAIERLCHIQLNVETDEQTGFFLCTVPPLDDEQLAQNVQLLLEGLLVSLQSVEEEYGQHIVIHVHKRIEA